MVVIFSLLYLNPLPELHHHWAVIRFHGLSFDNTNIWHTIVVSCLDEDDMINLICSHSIWLYPSMLENLFIWKHSRQYPSWFEWHKINYLSIFITMLMASMYSYDWFKYYLSALFSIKIPKLNYDIIMTLNIRYLLHMVIKFVLVFNLIFWWSMHTN